MNVKITNMKDTKINGVAVYVPENASPYKETFFEWAESPLTASFKTSDISGGVITSWHHDYSFGVVEYHVDQEMFYFTKGTAIMLFADLKDGSVDMASVQMVRIIAGTQLIIDAGKAHFVAIADTDEPMNAIVVAPKMDAPRVALPEIIHGVA